MEKLNTIDHKSIGIFEFEDSQFLSVCKQFATEHMPDTIKNLLSQYLETNDFIDVFFVNDAQELKEKKTEKINQLIQSDDIIQELSKLDSSLKLSGIQNINQDIKNLLNKVYEDTGAAMTCNMYITPAINDSCFKFHADAQDVYAVQVYGDKQWLLPLNDQNEFKISFYETGTTSVQDFEKLERFDLNEGKAIKLSRGHIHRAINLSEKLSIHLSFSTFPDSDFDVIHLFTSKLLNFDKYYLKDLILNNDITEEATSNLLEMLRERITNIDITQELDKQKKTNKLRNSFIAKYGRPYSPEKIKLFELLTKVRI